MTVPIVGYNGSIDIGYGSLPIKSWELKIETNTVDITGADSQGVQVVDATSYKYTINALVLFERNNTWIENITPLDTTISYVYLSMESDDKYITFDTLDDISGSAGTIISASIKLDVEGVIILEISAVMSSKPTYGTIGSAPE